MAIARSHLFSQIVGSVGGVTYFYNRYATIILRSRVSPVDPNTPAQQTVRTRFSASMAAWQALTQVQRDAWEIYASGTPWVNSLSDDVRLPGMNMYLSVRLAALKINPLIPLGDFDLPPCTPGLFPQETVSLSPCTSGVLNAGFKLGIVNNHPTATVVLGVHMSSAQNLSVNFWDGPYDDRSYFATPPIAPTFGISTDRIGLIPDKRYFLRYRLLNASDNNIVSSPWHCSVVASFCAS